MRKSTFFIAYLIITSIVNSKLFTVSDWEFWVLSVCFGILGVSIVLNDKEK